LVSAAAVAVYTAYIDKTAMCSGPSGLARSGELEGWHSVALSWSAMAGETGGKIVRECGVVCISRTVLKGAQ
jgi:hypothetical protein